MLRRILAGRTVVSEIEIEIGIGVRLYCQWSYGMFRRAPCSGMFSLVRNRDDSKLACMWSAQTSLGNVVACLL